MIDATELNKIKTHMTKLVDNLSEEDIQERSDKVLLIDYYVFKLGKTEVVLPTHALPLFGGKNEPEHSSKTCQ